MLTLDLRCRASVKSTGRSGRPKAILWVSICTLVRLQRRSRQLKGRLAMVLLCCALWPQASVLCSMAKNGFSPLTLTHSGFLEASSPENPPVSVSSFLPYRSSVLRAVDLTVLVTSRENGLGARLCQLCCRKCRLWEPWVCLHVVSKLHQFRPPAVARGGLSKIQGQP